MRDSNGGKDSSTNIPKNYIKTLFDFTFTSYLTLQMMPVLYAVLILASGIAVVQSVIDAFGVSNTKGWFYLVLSPFAFIVVISAWRGVLEFVLVTFRIAEDMEKLSGMRDSVDKISGMTDFSSLTSRIPFVRLLAQANRNRRHDEENDFDDHDQPRS